MGAYRQDRTPKALGSEITGSRPLQIFPRSGAQALNHRPGPEGGVWGQLGQDLGGSAPGALQGSSSPEGRWSCLQMSDMSTWGWSSQGQGRGQEALQKYCFQLSPLLWAELS